MLSRLKNEWKEFLEAKLKDYLGSNDIAPLSMGVPPKREMGDVAFPMFPYSKAAKKSPKDIAEDLLERIGEDHPVGEVILAGPYFNVKLDISALSASILKEVEEKGDDYGKGHSLDGKKTMVEFSCPNTNKPLHLGHMRNDSIGESVSALIKSQGSEVMKVNLINNRGVHICKSMLAYKVFGNGETPESTGEKGDHFVGRYYVRFAQWEKEAEEEKKNNPDCVNRPDWIDPGVKAQEMLKAWEDGDEEVRALWQKMNNWTLQGLEESYKNMGISFDKYYYESETYKYGKEEVLKGLEKGVFQKEEDGSVQVDLSSIGLDKKVLLRKDGTSLYMTQDL